MERTPGDDHTSEPGQPGEGQVFLGAGAAPSVNPRTDQIAHLYQLGDPTLFDLDLDSLLDELLVRVQGILAVDTVAVLLIDERRGVLEACAAKGLEEEVEQGVVIPIRRGFAGRVAAERRPIFIADVNHADIVNPILREKGIRSLLGVPLVVEAGVIGVLHVGTVTPREFTEEDASVLQLAATRAAPAIERVRLFQALEHEHRGAVALQRSLLPERLPELVGMRLAARYLPARDEVGGDWYDLIELGRGRLGIAIGDVVGHGVRAAALMGHLRTGLRAYALDGLSPGAVLERLDRLLQSNRKGGMATAAYGVFDPESGELVLASAGHPPPLILPREGEPFFLERGGSPPLGTMPYAGFPEQSVMLPGEDIVVLYTDGLVEVRGEALEQGLERLVEAVRHADSPDAVCDRALESLVAPGGGGDDLAIVATQSASISERLSMRLPADPTVLADVRLMLRRWLHHLGAGGDDIGAIMLACGEACANAIEHAYSPAIAAFELSGDARGDVVTLAVRDSGKWRSPRGEHRGRGLTIMEATMDDVEVKPTADGTEVVMRRRLRGAE